EARQPQRGWVNQQCKSAVFIGCILGQCCMGYVGDLVGREPALRMTLALSAFGAAMSAALPWGDATTVYIIIIACRFVIGFGLGGVYPLSATSAAEADDDDELRRGVERGLAQGGGGGSRGRRLLQTPGQMAPYLVAIVLRAVMQSEDESLQWRLLLGIGALPATTVVLLNRPKTKAPHVSKTLKTNKALSATLRDPATWRKMAGTGGGWLLYDIAFYGMTLMGPAVVATCFKGQESIMDEAWQQLVALSFGMPAVLSTTALIRRGVDPKFLQYAGFYLMVAAYLAFVALRIANAGGWLLFAVYCSINFCLNFGPNVTTFVLPSATYPRETRSTLNGASSALGKLGAVIGTEALPVLNNAVSLNAVLFACAGVALVGALITHLCVDDVLQIDHKPEAVPCHDRNDGDNNTTRSVLASREDEGTEYVHLT
ncbi:hypothetical protein CTAYLR_002415, partial [Chrysophaeum taylorii]